MSDRGHLDAANTIGERLADTAVWHEGRCGWVGAWPVAEPDGSAAITYSALGPDLYAGTSGIALFLAELHAATGGQRFRRTAIGALRQALDGARELPASAHGSLYGGALGVALAGALAGSTLKDERTLEGAHELAAAVELEPGAHALDLMGGDAGACVALLALAELSGEERPPARAIDFGASLIATAVSQHGRLSWPARGTPGEPRLTGLSHGASGCALALLEMWSATGTYDWLVAAAGAFAYERSLFDLAAGNWPDLRALASGGDERRSFATMWCHGAPGIALARLRAIELGVGGTDVLGEARAALDTTRAAVEAELAHGGNFSLCHGLAGNAEILLEGFAVLGAERTRDAELARQVAVEGTARYDAPGCSWPCGTFEGETPGLFLGLAGIGRFYLRLHDPSLPSLLLPRPDRLAGGISRSGGYSSPRARGYVAR